MQISAGPLVCAHCEQVVPRLHVLIDDRRPPGPARPRVRKEPALVCRLCYIRLAGIEPHRARAAVVKAG